MCNYTVPSIVNTQHLYQKLDIDSSENWENETVEDTQSNYKCMDWYY